MSYASLGELCGATKIGAPFSDKPKVILNSNFGGVSYAPKIAFDPFNPKTMNQCDGATTFSTAYKVQMNPYASNLCAQSRIMN